MPAKYPDYVLLDGSGQKTNIFHTVVYNLVRSSADSPTDFYLRIRRAGSFLLAANHSFS